SPYFDRFVHASSGVVAKIAHAWWWRDEPKALRALDSYLKDEYRQFQVLRDSLSVLRDDPDLPLDFGWAGGPGRPPFADILAAGTLPNGDTILFKQELHGSTLAEIRTRYGQDLPPEMIQGLRKIYDLSQALYRRVTVDGRPFMLDIYPSNLVWVE